MRFTAEEQDILQRSFGEFIFKDVFSTITAEDILKIKSPGVWLWQGKPLAAENIITLQEQAKQFANSFLWKTLKADLQWHAGKSLLEGGQTPWDIRAAQLLGFLTRQIDKRLREMGANSETP